MAIGPILSLFSGLYRAGLTVDRFVRTRRRRRLPRPVLSIGNITVGGTGKTPLLIHLSGVLTARGLKPAILTRGYRGWGEGRSATAVFEGRHVPDDASDEVRLMAASGPGVWIGVGADRFETASRLLALTTPDLFLLDDGFQHWPLERDEDWVCIDATNPWGGGACVPKGLLREPLAHLRRASRFLVTRTELARPDTLADVAAVLRQLAPGRPLIRTAFRLEFFHLEDGSLKKAAPLPRQACLAVSGIGNPGAFEKNLEREFSRVHPARYSDHHAYSLSDWNAIQSGAEKKKAAVVLTEKDWIKLERFIPRLSAFALPIFVAKARLMVDPSSEEEWNRAVDRLEAVCLEKSNI